MKKTCYKITYTNKVTRERLTYMRIGFVSKESAIQELRKIKEQKRKIKGINYYNNNIKYNSCILLGINFRIKKVKVYEINRQAV